jgi:hypothetical protein
LRFNSMLDVAIITALFLLGFQLLVANRRGAEARVEALIAEVPAATWHFVALQYCYGVLNRTYLVFVTADMICAAKVRGLLAAPLLVSDRWRNPLFYPRPHLVARYRRANLEGPEFKRRSAANFQLLKREVTAIRFSSEPKWGMGTVPYSGRLFITTTDGMTQELILLGKQDGPAIRARLCAAGFGATA